MQRARAVVAMLLAFQLGLAPPAHADGFVEKHIKKGGRWVEKKAKKLESSGRKFLANPVDYTVNLPVRILVETCSAPAQYYEKVLREDNRGSWNYLPESFVKVVQPYYSINLRSVRFSTGSQTANGAAQTFGNRIYFPSSINLWDRSDVHWMLHELEHVVQFRGGTYGKAGKLCEYMAKSVGSGFDHDAIDMERAAESKANQLIDGVMEALNEPPEDQPRENEIKVVNQNAGPLRFGAETASIDRGMYTIDANSWMIITGSETDRWFNIYVSDTDSVGVDTKTCNFLVWNGPLVQVQTRPVARFGC